MSNNENEVNNDGVVSELPSIDLDTPIEDNLDKLEQEANTSPTDDVAVEVSLDTQLSDVPDEFSENDLNELNNLCSPAAMTNEADVAAHRRISLILKKEAIELKKKANSKIHKFSPISNFYAEVAVNFYVDSMLEYTADNAKEGSEITEEDV